MFVPIKTAPEVVLERAGLKIDDEKCIRVAGSYDLHSSSESVGSWEREKLQDRGVAIVLSNYGSIGRIWLHQKLSARIRLAFRRWWSTRPRLRLPIQIRSALFVRGDRVTVPIAEIVRVPHALEPADEVTRAKVAELEHRQKIAHHREKLRHLEGRKQRGRRTGPKVDSGIAGALRAGQLAGINYSVVAAILFLGGRITTGGWEQVHNRIRVAYDRGLKKTQAAIKANRPRRLG